MNNLENLKEYTFIKVYLRGYSEPVMLKNDNLKMEQEPNLDCFIFTNSTTQLIAFKSEISAILMSR